MSFKDRIKEARLNNNFTQEQLAEKIGVAKSTLAGYERGTREPNLETTIKIMSALGIDANYLWQDDMDFPIKVSYSEVKYIERYRSLNERSQHIIDMLLDELEQCTSAKPAATDEPIRFVQYYQRLASAGTGQVVFEDMAVDRIQIPDIPRYKRVSYAIGVNGNSMEPLYRDSDILLVEPTCQVDIGEIGIFNVDGNAYVKKLGDGILISLNRDCENVPLTENSLCMGRVVDRIES